MNPNFFESDLLAIAPDRLAQVIESRRVSLEVSDRINRTPTQHGAVDGKIAVIPVRGYISNHPSIWTDLGIESSSEAIAHNVNQAVNDPAVGAVIMDIDSPGGTVYGLTSAAQAIYGSRGKKPLIAVANGLMASAAYFLGSAADEVIADPDSEVGSIGSVMVHVDASEFLERNGYKVTVIRSDEKKFRGSPYEPLDEDTQKEFQDTVNRYAGMFRETVAKHRDKPVSDILATFGQGSVLSAIEAKNVGMIDRVSSMSEVIDKLLGRWRSNRARGRAVKNLNQAKQLMFRRQPIRDCSV